jgi:hypothetical protein
MYYVYFSRYFVTSNIDTQAYLNGLAVLTEDIHPYNGLVELRVGTLGYIVVEMLFVSQSIHTFENKVEQSLQVLWAGTCHKNV